MRLTEAQYLFDSAAPAGLALVACLVFFGSAHAARQPFDFEREERGGRAVAAAGLEQSISPRVASRPRVVRLLLGQAERGAQEAQVKVQGSFFARRDVARRGRRRRRPLLINVIA